MTLRFHSSIAGKMRKVAGNLRGCNVTPKLQAINITVPWLATTRKVAENIINYNAIPQLSHENITVAWLATMKERLPNE